MKRKLTYWTPRYVTDRVAEILYQRLHPDAPWLTPAAVSALDSLLRPTDIGIEFGSGRSTTWFARRVGHLTSVEHREVWYRRVSERIVAEGLKNVDYRLVSGATDGLPDLEPYLSSIKEIEDESVDFGLVDGTHRDECAHRLIPKIRTGGLLIIDNINWHFPSASRAPHSIPSEQEASAVGRWREVHRELSQWRVLWSSSGVTDTAIFFKRPEAAGA